MAPTRIVSVVSTLLVAVLLGGCGSFIVRHVPEPPPLTSSQVPDLRGAPPLAIKAAESSVAEIEIGTVGAGKVVGNLHDWTAATVAFAKTEFARAGATVSPVAPKVLTLSISRAQVRAIPIVGGATGTVALAVTAGGRARVEFEGSGSSLAPLSAINAATSDAVRLMLADPAIVAFLRQ